MNKHLLALFSSTDGHKSPWLSKTLWINGLTFIGSVLLAITATGSPEWAIAALAGVNVALRFITKEPITK